MENYELKENELVKVDEIVNDFFEHSFSPKAAKRYLKKYSSTKITTQELKTIYTTKAKNLVTEIIKLARTDSSQRKQTFRHFVLKNDMLQVAYGRERHEDVLEIITLVQIAENGTSTFIN